MTTGTTNEAWHKGWLQAHRWVIIGVLVALAVVGLITYGFHQNNEEARAKAEQLTTALDEAGLRAPANQETIVNILGSDGGVVCANPGAALREAYVDQQFVNGAANVGQRGIIGEVRLVDGALIVLEVYCPEKVDEFRKAVEDLKLDHVVKY